VTYYEQQIDNTLPKPGARLTVLWECPTYSIDIGRGYMENAPRGRTRIVIEGESHLVERIYDAASSTIEEIKREIG
jgi:hypothetical protein